ncbi:MAG: nicotinate-nucleotide--dimethylbenzimidazole phosphoribosyltransferase [Halobacteriales archaeon]
MRFVIAAGSTETARIDGISAAGADGELLVHTPSADAEILSYGRLIRAPAVPVSPTGCPTPAVITRAVRDCLEFDTLVLDAGLARPTGAPTVSLTATPGRDIREPIAVPGADEIIESARQIGRSIPDDVLYVGETIPGGTTTALGVLRALGIEGTVSSSLSTNPIARKERIVADGLAASDLGSGDAAGDPRAAIRQMGDPVLAALFGLVSGALGSNTEVTLAGGTQLLAVGALLRHADRTDPIALATTRFVADDETATLKETATALDLSLTVTDPGFDASDHVAMARYAAGEAKEGVGMGGALALVEESTTSMATVRERITAVYDQLLA